MNPKRPRRFGSAVSFALVVLALPGFGVGCGDSSGGGGHGDSDKFVSPAEVAQFTHQMDSIGAKYTLKHYANATHAFTNPAATENGKKFSMPIEYNAAADSASFNDMMAFFDRIF